MPGKIKVKILAGRNLPVMDRSGDTTDAYVEIKFGNTTYKTDVCRKSLNPQWNSEWYRFEVDDAELQDEPLQVRLMDHDTYSANDAIGKVYVNLNPLLLPGLPPAVKNIWTLEATINSSSGSQGGSVMTGWIPVFDTMHGIRGEVNIIVKVELFSDCNKFRQSSCGVQFFYSPNIPHGYHAQVIHGFVEELVVSDDPEYKWIDKIRTPRASNEARQTLFFKLSGEVQRKIGLKALDLGGNAVIGYVQNFDLEGESGIVARGIGTAVTLVKLQDISSVIPVESSNIEDLTSFGLQSKNHYDLSESDDSLPLLSHSPNLTPQSRSPTNLRPTTVSPRFPKHERAAKHHQRQAICVAEYRAAGLRSRQLSLQHSSASSNSNQNIAMRKSGAVSSLSLADDLMSESSLRNLLALEDMRGEPASNAFSRGLKNFRYLHQNILPRRVAQIKSKISDSLDDESEPESNYSSTWSLAGSESNRSSSIADLRQSIRRKKFTHKKATNDGIAAMLIRSVHSGFPLDSVREDRETPTPSPVNFLADLKEFVEFSDEQKKMTEVTDKSDVPETNEGLIDSRNEENKILRLRNKKRDAKYTSELLIPMISSSETDTSTSDDDDDEPSESSTNYNILEDTYSLLDPSSLDEGKFDATSRRAASTAKFSESSGNDEKSGVSRKSAGSKEETKIGDSEEDQHLESSTDYNILEDNYLLIEPDSIDFIDEKIQELFGNKSQSLVTREGFAVERENEGDRSSTSQSDENLESSTDYHILDEIYPPLVRDFLPGDKREVISSTRPTIVSVILKKIETSLVKDEETNTEGIEVSNALLDSQTDCDSKVNHDDEIMDGTCLSVDRGCPEEQNFEPEGSAPSKFIDELLGKNEDVEIARATGISTVPQEDSQNVELEILTESLPIERSLSEDKIVASSAENNEELIVDETRDENPAATIMLRDCHSTSSTNYNFLDESSSPIDTSSIDCEKFEPPAQAIEVADPPKIPISPTFSTSPVAETLENISDATEATKFEQEVTENMSSNSRSDEKLESSTDYNILDDTFASLVDPISLDAGTSHSSLQQTIEFMKSPEVSISSMSNLLELQKNCQNLSLLEKSEILAIDSQSEVNLSPISLPNFLASPPISPSCEEHIFDFPVPRSPSPAPGTSPNTKLKHLKFLPKQKHFDSTEDEEFVTSTPVETDIALFPDFESKEKSSESSKIDKESLPPSPNAEFPVTEKRPEALEKQICPLGLSFEKITKATEIRTAPASKTPKINNQQLEIQDLSASEKTLISPKDTQTSEVKNSPIKKEKSQKKIERTATVIYKGPAREKFVVATKATKTLQKPRNPIPIPIVVAPPPEEHATRLQVPVIQTTNINVQSTFSPDEMKTQHFGSIGSRKFPVDERAIGEKFGRKYRQHCMLDLIKTIDAKMMIHHAHHERRDSTKSKRKRRERINASATPSPDSIHRTRPHRRRSRSRSPDRPPHVHSKAQVSSLSTHSFPNSTVSLLKNASANPIQDSHSCDSSSYENISRNFTNPPIVVCSKETIVVAVADLSKENTISLADVDCSDEQLKNPKETDVELRENLSNVPVKSATILLDPNDIEHPVFKSHSAGSLERLRERFIVNTKSTNMPNATDDLCVPCPLPITLRQPDEQPSSPVPPAPSALPSSLGSKVPNNSTTTTTTTTTATTTAAAKTNNAIPNMHRRSSDSDLSITPKGNSLAGSDRSMGGHLRPSTAIVRTMNQDTMEMLEYPFITMQQYPAGFILNIGGLVSARSVKLLERITNLEEPEGRDAWWTEIRMEVRSHARALACNVVLGYKEEISICDDVCVLNASGTAAVINLLNASQDQDSVLLSRTIMTTSIESEREKNQAKSSNPKTSDKSEESSVPGQSTHSAGKVKRTSESNDHEMPYLPTLSACSLCHLPYSEASVPFRVDVSKCAICRRAKVPDVLFTTIELPENIPMTGRGVFLQATVCKCKRDLRGELNAKEISDCLPFLEYELHSLLLNKLKVKGMNAIFGLKVQVSVGERLVIGMAVGTAVYLTALPTPSVPKIASGNSWHNEEQLAEIQKTLIETVRKNREFYRLKPITEMENGRSITTSDTDESDDDLPDLDLGIGTKDACVLEVDDVEDMDRINLLMDERPPDDFHVVNTQTIPGLEDLEIVRNLQMFTQISRTKIPAGQFASMPSKYFARMLQTVLFKLRRMVPCALCDMQFKVALPEQDEIQLSVVGMALGLGEPTRFSKYKRKLMPNSTSKDPVKRTDENDMIFSLDEDQADNSTSGQEPANNQSNTNASNSSPLTGLSAQKHRPRSPFRTRSHMQHRHKHVPLKERYGVDITPLSYLPGGKIERYLGNLNFFFIRESTSIRENGGLSGFTHSFVTEILAIVRAHITALGGNAMVAFFMTQCVLLHSPHKNQGQSLINVGGDVVTVSYYGDDKHQGSQNC